MTGRKVVVKKNEYSFGDFGDLNGQIHGSKGSKPSGSKGGAKPAPAKPASAKSKSTPVQDNEHGFIMMGKLTVLTDKQKDKALRAGDLPRWRPFVESPLVQGKYTPKGVKPLRPADGAVPDRATGSVSRPAGRGHVTKVHVPHPNNALGVQPRPKPGYQMPLGILMTYGGETKLNGGKPIDANYFEDAHLL